MVTFTLFLICFLFDCILFYGFLNLLASTDQSDEQRIVLSVVNPSNIDASTASSKTQVSADCVMFCFCLSTGALFLFGSTSVLLVPR